MIFKATRTGDPTVKPYANNNPDYPSMLMPSNQNPVAMAERDISGYNENVNKNFQSTLTLTYEFPFVKGLIFTGRYSYDSNNYMGKNLGKRAAASITALYPETVAIDDKISID